MNRTPPVEVRRALRREVGFGCPVPSCGNPYLFWHHFDPPWGERQHHDPSGMIALCGEHHAKADAGAFTKSQLQQFKRDPAWRDLLVRGRFDWMRYDLLGVIGGNFYHDQPVLIEFRGQPVVWFTRDPDGYLLVNLRMLSTSTEPRFSLEENFWCPGSPPLDLESPPNGRLVRVEYANGDMIRVEFVDADSAEFIANRYAFSRPSSWGLSYPITLVEVTKRVAGTTLDFGPTGTKLGGMHMVGCFMSRNGRAGLSIG